MFNPERTWRAEWRTAKRAVTMLLKVAERADVDTATFATIQGLHNAIHNRAVPGMRVLPGGRTEVHAAEDQTQTDARMVGKD